MTHKHSIDIEQLYEFLDLLREDLAKVDKLTGRKEFAQAYEFNGIIESYGEFLGYWTAYGIEIPAPLTAPKKLLNKFIKMQGEVKISEAKILAEKMVSYLKSIEGEISSNQRAENDELEFAPPQEVNSYKFQIEATSWIIVENTPDVQLLITELSDVLERIVLAIKTTNLPPDQLAISDIERAQLIAILKTVLRMLEAPLVEKGLIKRAADGLKSASEEVAKEKTEKAIGKLAEKAYELIVKFAIKALKEFPGS